MKGLGLTLELSAALSSQVIKLPSMYCGAGVTVGFLAEQ